MEKTRNGRDINRHYYTSEEVAKEQERPVVAKLKELMKLRNSHPAFSLEGEISIKAENDKFEIVRKYKKDSIALKADLTTYDFEIV